MMTVFKIRSVLWITVAFCTVGGFCLINSSSVGNLHNQSKAMSYLSGTFSLYINLSVWFCPGIFSHRGLELELKPHTLHLHVALKLPQVNIMKCSHLQTPENTHFSTTGKSEGWNLPKICA